MLNPSLNDPKMFESVETFLKAYKNLGPAGRKAFEIQIVQVIKSMDERTKKLYLTLINAAQRQLNVTDALSEMEKTAGETK